MSVDEVTPDLSSLDLSNVFVQVLGLDEHLKLHGRLLLRFWQPMLLQLA